MLLWVRVVAWCVVVGPFCSVVCCCCGDVVAVVWFRTSVLQCGFCEVVAVRCDPCGVCCCCCVIIKCCCFVARITVVVELWFFG